MRQFINDYLSAIGHGARLKVGLELCSNTSEIRPIIVGKRECQFPPRLLSDARLIIVDTPGFNRGTGICVDVKLMDELATWFRDTYVRPFSTQQGGFDLRCAM